MQMKPLCKPMRLIMIGPCRSTRPWAVEKSRFSLGVLCMASPAYRCAGGLMVLLAGTWLCSLGFTLLVSPSLRWLVGHRPAPMYCTIKQSQWSRCIAQSTINTTAPAPHLCWPLREGVPTCESVSTWLSPLSLRRLLRAAPQLPLSESPFNAGGCVLRLAVLSES